MVAECTGWVGCREVVGEAWGGLVRAEEMVVAHILEEWEGEWAGCREVVGEARQGLVRSEGMVLAHILEEWGGEWVG